MILETSGVAAAVATHVPQGDVIVAAVVRIAVAVDAQVPQDVVIVPGQVVNPALTEPLAVAVHAPVLLVMVAG